MYQANSNRQANPFAPMSRQMNTRTANPGVNPGGYGMQRVAGQLAPQRAAQGYQSNPGMQARMPGPSTTQPNQTGLYGMTAQNQPNFGMAAGAPLYGNGTLTNFGTLLPKGGELLIDPATGLPAQMGAPVVDWS